MEDSLRKRLYRKQANSLKRQQLHEYVISMTETNFEELAQVGRDSEELVIELQNSKNEQARFLKGEEEPAYEAANWDDFA